MLMKRVRRFCGERSAQYWVLVAFLIIVLLTAGGSRADIVSLVYIRPLSVGLTGYGLYTLRYEQYYRYKFPMLFAGFALALLIVNLIPLPPIIWTALPGREIIVSVDAAAGLQGQWRPITMAPLAAWNALYSLFTPIAVLLLGAQLSRDDRSALLRIFIGFGVLLAVVGLLQAVAPNARILYFYRRTNDSMLVGFFANRNHFSIYLGCMFPMLVAYASLRVESEHEARFRRWLAIAVGVMLMPLLLVSGSRAGMIVGTLGVASIPFLLAGTSMHRGGSARRGRARASRAKVKSPQKSPGTGPASVDRGALLTEHYMRLALGGLLVIGLAALFVFFSRGVAVERLLHSSDSERRIDIWTTSMDIAWRYFPFGSGFGSFVEVFKLYEPQSILIRSYANHAHNDWIEVLMTGGVVGVGLLLAVCLAYGRGAVSVWRYNGSLGRDVLLGRLSSIVLLLLGLASAGDYPLRVPSLMCFATVLVLWLQNGFIVSTGREKTAELESLHS